MSYSDNSENKIRRKKVSSSNSHKRQERSNIENSAYNKQLNRGSNRANKKDFDEIEKEIYYRKKRRKSKKRNNIFKNCLKSILALIVILSVISGVVVAVSLKGSPILNKEMIYANYKTTNIVDINEIPDDLKNAIVATEDKRFYGHNGVEVRSLIRSAISNIFNASTQGGSTIDMQVSKNLLTNDEKSIKRKIKDIYNAMQMNKIMTKDEILSAYLNNIYFGKSSYGVAQAAQTYFGQDVRTLNLAQCALLSGITNNPARYMQHDEAKRRQKTILSNMYEQGYIDHSEYIRAVNDPTPFKSEID
ncbi:MAG: biosynthetic peptidoglycan transglycosylase [Terrisporobacter sp.]|uniref:biosynthetic peptidoglycan transglycosylase n=1 Tax=Terrisporobacter sp. TaxID=1965305 RepID=UPI002FC5CECC